MRPALSAWIRRVFGPHAADVGFAPPAPGQLDRRGLVTLLGTEGADPQIRARALEAVRADLAAATHAVDLGPAPRIAIHVANTALIDELIRIRPRWAAKMYLATLSAALLAHVVAAVPFPKLLFSAMRSLDVPRDALAVWEAHEAALPLGDLLIELQRQPGFLCSAADLQALEAVVTSRDTGNWATTHWRVSNCVGSAVWVLLRN